jgi:hypothetical protein
MILHSDTPTPTTSIPQLFDPDCAWCLEAMGITPQDGSHGICATHRADMDRQYEEYRAAREERKKGRA